MAVIGIVREPAGEARVSATPATIASLGKLGHTVRVERGAGAAASYPDAEYAAAGAALVDRAEAWGSEIVLAITAPGAEEISLLSDDATLIALLSPALRPDLVQSLAQRGITALALDAVPRISRAQSMDVLSSMANIAGYRAVVEAAHEFGRFFTGQVTAAGKVPPAKVLVAGAGVAGLAAIGAASSLGAIVRATDPRPEVADQVTSIGGSYLPVDVEVAASTDGYAKATSADYDRRAAEIYTEQAADVDIIITTALIPGRAAPRLITASDVAQMKPGSVIVDMAAGQGGNVEGSVAGERVVTDNGVIILGYTDLASRLAAQASQLYGTNLANLVALLTPAKDGRLVIDFDDVVQRSVTVVRDGEVTWPPPAVQVAAAPAPKAAAAPVEVAPPKKMSAARKVTLIVVGVAALFAVNAFAPAPLPQHFTVLVLSVVIGFYVIGKVHHALHTPLMSVTNAISGVIVVGAMLQITSPLPVVQVLAAIAVLLASINIFGGFAVTRRMLAMFTLGTSAKGGRK
ncbi:Re/Si-specific NAD(P)(+) transhydrogenase subunit alpha [Microbacterium sp.]|uniref:Re/Si-specific NAD(P)(+) transhydrogenase subunit alpha n=1 Tax=Microbacterium sp. TaxID=51671 RepID=UPI0026224D4E|nr:Re/Si-specific NAD(P)(+) transhydrogenase subunit alpha [Microbacterium sp.]MCV0334152.1 Re/Si-specific NAD(P)(+) transhydrogenase subunit alpha [Microbacterium sp.]MCV0374320.1 Re/Si-specific NAD(P)(+) transhydrogenase subunit alpha [Microbacterium sp.]MCV0389392.1 Re/Si-specific NAD(P)(+) transhydrogenase subunit alpha [Microbacterium sp.]MCV0418926.1 Re/Si-specific NAD(P)(+) transhydrogenase subunit alpha [Microbacterium sp.]MCV0421232.1 Re/Si-specific NAD(P)(+) transhydrogenase subunit 